MRYRVVLGLSEIRAWPVPWIPLELLSKMSSVLLLRFVHIVTFLFHFVFSLHSSPSFFFFFLSFIGLHAVYGLFYIYIYFLKIVGIGGTQWHACLVDGMMEDGVLFRASA